MNNLFVSDDKTKFITTFEGCPCFIRGSHQEQAKQRGLDLSIMENKTFEFYYTGKGQSIKQFLK